MKVPSTQSRIIGFLYKESFKRDIFQKDIEEAFGIRRSSVTNVVQLMDKNGYIERVSVAEDARLKKIVLTDKGLEVQKIVGKVLEEAENSLRGVYSEEELSQLFYLLDKLSHALEE
ncbi:MAG: MarR family winged helix-turn-helix transcriptional regulator [Candidatus Cellulosilyticum pullistercoris]|uniref:MarR family winged helix-turn-helix transcriptional regulator n=1 Tax=Candidatus Cellulosilyticum pullistercoris TaxID=2838521 RepID=A0A9E2NLS2_9FIRM|nr:MarR family winged helix-turn-helix transcriptional regulator [Candidatus Cellulosilyticum pullistercoris]